jgi:hypothetical protein
VGYVWPQGVDLRIGRRFAFQKMVIYGLTMDISVTEFCGRTQCKANESAWAHEDFEALRCK